MLLNASLVKENRIKKGWTQTQLAELSDLSVRTIQRAENSGIASMETTSALAAVFEIDRQELLAVDGVVTIKKEIKLAHFYTGIGVAFIVGIGFGVYLI